MPPRKASKGSTGGKKASTQRSRVGSRSPASPARKASRSGNGRSRAEAAGQNDAISLLLRDHDRVRDLLAQLVDSDDRDVRRELLDVIEHEIKIHSKVEEKIFYPAFKRAARDEDGQKLFYEAKEEHHVVDMVIPELKRTDPSTDEFAGKAKVLKDLIEHHAGEEEREMFPEARRSLGKDELARLGLEIEKMKEDLSQR
jgi:hemerythrin-like domain-containing protein